MGMVMDMAEENCTFGGFERMEELGFATNLLWFDVLALVIYIGIVLTLTYVVLLVIKRNK